MRREKLPKDAKQRKKLFACLTKKGWSPFDASLLLGYSLKPFKKIFTGNLNSFQNMIYHDENTRSRMVKFYLELHDIRAEM